MSDIDHGQPVKITFLNADLKWRKRFPQLKNISVITEN